MTQGFGHLWTKAMAYDINTCATFVEFITKPGALTAEMMCGFSLNKSGWGGHPPADALSFRIGCDSKK